MARFAGNGRYVVGEKLGSGGMGVVYVAEDLARTERVAIKIAHADQVGDQVVREHMERELRVGRATRHPNVVSVFDGGIEEGRPFIVMELATGQTLTSIASGEQRSIRRITAIVDQLLAGLAGIHHAGYIHGDVKTDNILVARGDAGDVVKIIDLGLAREHRDSTSIDDERMISGTPDYLAPEVVRGGVKTVASDIYAAGVVLYELLTGTTPFSGRSVFEILRKQIHDEVMPPSLRVPELELSLSLERVVMRALRKDPSERYASAAEFRSALVAAARDSRDVAVATRAFSATGDTLAWTSPDLPRPRARGTNPPPVRDPQLVIEGALDATRRLLAQRRMAAARAELEAALRLVEGDAVAERMAWRLLLALAAICDALREPRRARELARRALDCAARNGSEVGRRRAKALIERFAGRSRLC